MLTESTRKFSEAKSPRGKSGSYLCGVFLSAKLRSGIRDVDLQLQGDTLRQKIGLKAVGGLAAGALIALSLASAPAAMASTSASGARAAGGDVISGSARLTPAVASLVHGTGLAAREKALASYWSPARRAAAKPESQIPGLKGAKPGSGGTTAATGPAARVQGTSSAAIPKPMNLVGETHAAPRDSARQSLKPNYSLGSPVARTAGKVFFTSFGVNYVCSGTIVNTEGKSTVWTAGHCVTDGGAWNSNWVFVPNYVSGIAPYGVWTSYQLWTTSAWFYNNNDFANDVGASIMNRNGGVRITDYLGGQGIAWNYGIGYYMHAFGYPQAYPYNGCCLVEAAGYTYNGGGGTMYMLNYMTGGSSGGAWLNWFDGNWGYINGHNDFKYNAYPQYMYSPYYGNQVGSLYNAVRYIST